MIQKSEDFLHEKTANITKREHPFKGFASTYNIENLNSFNHLKILNMQLKVS